MTVGEAAKQIGISESKLYQLVAARAIAHYRVGGKILFQPSDIASFLAKCRVGVEEAPLVAPKRTIRLKHVSLVRAGNREPGSNARNA
jgi:excisionase family DNA binding protein